MPSLRRVLPALFTVAVLGTVVPSTAKAQACTPSQLAANPLVSMGYGAFIRINDDAFNVSCYFSTYGLGIVGLSSIPSITVGSGLTADFTSVVEASFMRIPTPLGADFQYSVSSSIRAMAAPSADFVFLFTAPLTNLGPDLPGYATFAQVGVTRASGNATVTTIDAGAASTLAVGGFPSYLYARSGALVDVGVGSSANPFATDGVATAGTGTCSSANGTACAYDPGFGWVDSDHNAWGVVISYHQERLLNAQGQQVAGTVLVNGETSLYMQELNPQDIFTPEPATLALMSTGLAAVLAGSRLRRRKKSA